MNCPRCKTNLKSVLVKGVELDMCQSCDGVWFDKDELIKVINASTEELEVSSISDSLYADKLTQSPNKETGLVCPECSSRMDGIIYCYDSSINIDACRICGGIWLDDGEIKEIIEYVHKNQASLSPEKMAEIKSKLKKIEDDFKKVENEFIDSLVHSDAKPGLAGKPGKVLQSIYGFFYRSGI